MIGKKLIALGLLLVIAGLAIHFVRIIFSMAGLLVVAGLAVLAVGLVTDLWAGRSGVRRRGGRL